MHENILLRDHLYIAKSHRVGGPESGNFPLIMQRKCPYIGWLHRWILKASRNLILYKDGPLGILKMIYKFKYTCSHKKSND